MSVIGILLDRSINSGKKECPANLHSPLDLSIVSNDTHTNKVGSIFCYLISYLNPKKGLRPVEKETEANPRWGGTGWDKEESMHATNTFVNIVLSGRCLAQST